MEDLNFNSNRCQLESIYEKIEEITGELNTIDKLWLFSLRLKSALLRRIKKRILIIQRKDLSKTILNSSFIKPSDKRKKRNPSGKRNMIRVCQMEEIKKCLNKHSKTHGLEFVPSMQRFCGKKVFLLKKVRYFFDERAWKMRKCKDIVVLKDANCDGEGIFPEGTCDRNCFFFWHKSWLKKI